MTRFALRGLRARKARAVLTAIAVLLGVTMIAGTYVYSDAIDAAFDRLFADANAGADVVVSGRSDFGGEFTEPTAIPQGLVERIRRLPAVEAAEGQLQGAATIIGRDGRPVEAGSSPSFAVSAMPPPFQSLEIVSGRLPRGGNEVAIGATTARAQGLRLGGPVEVVTERPRGTFRLVGTVSNKDVDLGGSTLTVFALPTAQKLFLEPRRVDFISVRGRDDAGPRDLVSQIQPLLPATAQVKTATQEADDRRAQVDDQLSILTTGLLGFGFVAIFVGAFLIFNTFSITVAQRSREFAVLRSMGATRGQVLTVVLVEALAIGLIASIAGLWLGYGLADALGGLLSLVGLDLPSTDAILRPRTVLVSLAAGTLVTLAAAIVPAWRATRVAPVEALRGEAGARGGRFARRVAPALAVLLGAGGVALLAFGLLSDGRDSDQRLAVTAAGAIALVLGIALLSPRLVRPVARALGWPLERMTRIVGRLARGNAGRNPGRTAVTAAALMIGLALVLFVTVFANGLRVSSDQILDRAFTGDFAVYNRDGFSPIPAATAGAVAQAIPGGEVSAFRFADVRLGARDSASLQVGGYDPSTLPRVYEFDWVDGSDALLGRVGRGGVLVERTTAEDRNIGVGDRTVIRTPSGRSRPVIVRGIYDDPALLPGMAVPMDFYDEVIPSTGLAYLLVRAPLDVPVGQTQQQIASALTAFPEVQARSQEELKAEQAERVDQILALFAALLAMSVLVALFGLVNTLTLSVYERTRELGMLRAIGMSRRQVRRMVRYESVITAAIGGLLGLALGVFFAWIVTRSVADEGIVFALPWDQVGILFGLALAAGVVAAVLPARRASRLDVLGAIAHE